VRHELKERWEKLLFIGKYKPTFEFSTNVAPAGNSLYRSIICVCPVMYALN